MALGIPVDGSGNVYVLGFGSDNAFKITPGGVITEIIDATGDGAGNMLNLPFGIAVDGSGNVYVAGFLSNNAFKIALAPIIEDLTDAVGDLVTAGILNQGQGNSLISKLEAAREQLDKGNDIAAMNQLLAFINQVQGFITSGVLTSAEGQPLIDAATAIVDQIMAGA